MGGGSGKIPYLLVGKRRSRTDLRVVVFDVLVVDVEVTAFWVEVVGVERELCDVVFCVVIVLEDVDGA